MERDKELAAASQQYDNEIDLIDETRKTAIARVRYEQDDLLSADIVSSRKQCMNGSITDKQLKQHINGFRQRRFQAVNLGVGQAITEASLAENDALSTLEDRREKIEERYEDNIGYFAHKLETRQAADPRAAEWEDNPIIPA